MSIPLIPALRKADLWELEVSQGYIVILDTLSQKIDSPLCLWDAIIPQYDSYHKKKQLNSHGYYHNCNVTSDLLRILVVI